MASAPVHFERAVKFCNDATGKDRLFRLFIFVSKIVMWGLNKRGMAEAASRLRPLDSALNHTRRVLRLGKLGNALKQWHACYSNFWASQPACFIVELVKILSGNAYLICDHLRWLGEIGVFKLQWQKWADWSSHCWSIGLVGSLALDTLQLRSNFVHQQLLLKELELAQHSRNLEEEEESSSKDSRTTTTSPLTETNGETAVECPPASLKRVEEIEHELGQLGQKRELLYWDLARNIWDAPLAAAGSFKIKGIPEPTLSVCGTMSSLINVYLSWRSMFSTPVSKPPRK